MTQFTLSQGTQDKITTALAGSGTPGTNNINYYNAYSAIYDEMVAWNNTHPNDLINAGTLYWFSQAGDVNRHMYVETDESSYIWEYTRAAAKSEEGLTLTDGQIEAASNEIAESVFGRLAGNSFLFSDADTETGFAPKQIVGLDAGEGIAELQTIDGGLDFGIWGGALFARTLLQDPSYFADNNIVLEPNTRHAKAILDGLFAGADIVHFREGDIAQAFNLDIPAIYSIIPTEQKVAVLAGATLAYSVVPTLTALGALAAGVTYIWNAETKGFFTLSNVGDPTPGKVHAYDPDTNAWLAFAEGDAGEGMLALTNGQALEIGGTADLVLTDIQRGTSGSTTQAMVDFLAEIGATDLDTLSELYLANLDDLYPEGTPYNATGTVHALSFSEANYEFTTTEAAAIVVGEDLVTIQTGVDGGGQPIYGQVAPTNVLYASGDISQHELTDIDELRVVSEVAMTEAQFNSGFPAITGTAFSVSAATGGEFDASSTTISGLHKLIATDWSGTTLIGNNENGQILQASLLGDDTLQAGNGTGAVLVAGLGASTLTGGTGGDHFVATDTEVVIGADHLTAPGNGLAPGSEVDGNGTGNTLHAAGDISQATISGVQTLHAWGEDVTLTAEQFNDFDTIEGGWILYAATGGTYDWSEQENATFGTTYALSSAGTTLKANGYGSSQTLIASAYGDDTLIALEGNLRVLDASDSTGNVTLTVGDGDNNQVAAGYGVNTITLGTGDNNVVHAEHGLAAGSSITFGNTSDNGLVTQGDISGATLTAVHALGGIGDITLNATQLAGVSVITNNKSPAGELMLTAASAGTYSLASKTVSGHVGLNGSSGNDALTGSSGVNTINGNAGNDTITGGGGADVISGGDGDDTILIGSGEVPSGEIIDGGDGTDRLVVGNDGMNPSAATFSNLEELYLGSGVSSIGLVAAQLDDFDTVTHQDGGATAFSITAQAAGTYSLAGKTITGILTLKGSSSADTLTGSSGNDILRGMAGADTINGGDGDDTIQIFSGHVPSGESIDGGGGTDRLEVGSNNMNPSSMTVANMEELYLNSGVTAITLSASQLADFETITQATSAGFSITAAAAGTYSLAGKTLTGAATLNGSSGADTLTGSSGADTVNGNAGNDLIEGGAGNDTLNGGNDTDTLTYANAGSAVTVDLSNGSAQNTGGAGTDTISNFENLTGSAYNDNLTGTSSANVILGGDGNDTITGAAGADTIDGGVGTNSLNGAAGDDTYVLERTYGASDLTDNDSTGGNNDTLQLGDDIAPDQMWFRQSGNDLLINVIGTDAQMTVKDWYLGSDYQVEEIVTDDEDVLDHANVQNLVNAMSSLSVPETTTLSPAYHTALDSVIAANWA